MFSHMDRFRGANEQAGSMRFGSTRRKQISGEFSPRSGIISSHFRSETFLKIGPSLIAAIGSVVCARMLVNIRSATARRIGKGNFVVMIGSVDPAFRFHKKSYPILG